MLREHLLRGYMLNERRLRVWARAKSVWLSQKQMVEPARSLTDNVGAGLQETYAKG